MATGTVVDGDRYMRIDGRLLEIKRQLRQRSGYPYDVEALETELQRVVEGDFDGNFESRKEGGIPHDLFRSPKHQTTIGKEWNENLSLGFTKEDFKALGKPPRHKRDWGRLVVRVLVMYLETVHETFMLHWKLAAKEQEKSWFWDEYENPDSIRLLPGIEHPGKCLRWEIIDLGANWDKDKGIAPKDVRNPETSPHAGILAAAALHPNWVRTMDGTNVPYVWIPGYQVTVPSGDPWRVPDVNFDVHSREVGLNYRCVDNAHVYWAVPAFCGE